MTNHGISTLLKAKLHWIMSCKGYTEKHYNVIYIFIIIYKWNQWLHATGLFPVMSAVSVSCFIWQFCLGFFLNPVMIKQEEQMLKYPYSFRFVLIFNWCIHVQWATLRCLWTSVQVHEMFPDQDVGANFWLVELICGRRIKHISMIKSTEINMSDKKSFHLIDISAFSTPFFGILDVSQCTCSQNQYVLFILPCSWSVHHHLAKYSFSCTASIWLESNTDQEQPNTYECSTNTNKCSMSGNWERTVAWGAHKHVFSIVCSFSIKNRLKHPNAGQHWSFWMQSVKLIKSHSNVVSGCSSWIASTPYQLSSWSDEKCGRKWGQEVLPAARMEGQAQLITQIHMLHIWIKIWSRSYTKQMNNQSLNMFIITRHDKFYIVIVKYAYDEHHNTKHIRIKTNTQWQLKRKHTQFHHKSKVLCYS